MSWSEPGATDTLAGARVLVADDEAVIALEVEYLLGRAGAEVIGPAFNVRDALRLAEGSPISAAILDVRLGRESIEPVARALERANVPFVFFSGQMGAGDLQRQWSGRPFIHKPAPSAVLVEAIRALIDAEPATLEGHPAR